MSDILILKDIYNELRDIRRLLEKQLNRQEEEPESNLVKSARELARLHEPDYPADLVTKVGGHKLHLFTDESGEHVAYLDVDGQEVKIYPKE